MRRRKVLNDAEFPRSPWFWYDTKWGSLEGPDKKLHFLPGDRAHVTLLLELSFNNGIKFSNMLCNRWVIEGGKGLGYGPNACIETEAKTIRNTWVLVQQTSHKEVLAPGVRLVWWRGVKPFALEDSSEPREPAFHIRSTRDGSREWSRNNHFASASPSRGYLLLD